MAVQSVMFLGGVRCAFGFFGAGDVLLALKHGISGSVLIMAGLNLKLNTVPHMQADKVLGELKRVEPMLAVRNGGS